MSKKHAWDKIDAQIEALKAKREALMKKEGQKARKGSIVDLINERIERFNLADTDEDLIGDAWQDDVEGEFKSFNKFVGTGESGDPFEMTRQEVVDQANETYNDQLGDTEFKKLLKDIKKGIFGKIDLLKLGQDDCWLWKVDEKVTLPSYMEKDGSAQRKAEYVEEAMKNIFRNKQLVANARRVIFAGV